MKTLRSIEESYQFNHIVATGGIGTGMFFSVVGNETFGRNESRLADLMPYKDYCKQHIILHYLAVLLGGGQNFHLYPIGCVGADDAGLELTAMMKGCGMDTSFLSTTDKLATTFSVCIQYPDRSGGNITTASSASGSVNDDHVRRFFASLPETNIPGIALAVPEVPVSARITLLHEGRKRGYFNVSSVMASETEEFIEKGGVQHCDLLAVNLEEAGHIAQTNPHVSDPQVVATECAKRLTGINPNIQVLVTCGSSGVYHVKNDTVRFTPALQLNPISTAGAGDALLAGYLAGICSGLPPTKSRADETFGATPLESALELGTLVAAMSVLSPHTINEDINSSAIHQFITDRKFEMTGSFLSLFK